MRRGLRWLLGGTCLGIVSIAGLAWWLGSAFIAPANHPVRMPADFPTTDVAIAGDGHTIAASLRNAGAGTPIVLLLHGMGGDRRSTLPRAQRLVSAGFSVLMIDLQAHGATPGEHITLGLRESDIGGNHDEQDHESNSHLEPLRGAGNCARSN